MASAPLSAQLTIRGIRKSMQTLDENPAVKAALENIATNIRAFLATGDRRLWDPNSPMKPAYELQMAWAIANGHKDYLTRTNTGRCNNNSKLRAYLNGRVAGPPVCAAAAGAGAGAGASDDMWECAAYMLPTLPPLPGPWDAPVPVAAPSAPAAAPVPVAAPSAPAAAPVAAAPVTEVVAEVEAALEAEIAALRAENAALKAVLKALI